MLNFKCDRLWCILAERAADFAAKFKNVALQDLASASFTETQLRGQMANARIIKKF